MPWNALPGDCAGYFSVRDELTEIDRAKKRVQTAQGRIDYDWLAISAGFRQATPFLKKS